MNAYWILEIHLCLYFTQQAWTMLHPHSTKRFFQCCLFTLFFTSVSSKRRSCTNKQQDVNGSTRGTNRWISFETIASENHTKPCSYTWQSAPKCVVEARIISGTTSRSVELANRGQHHEHKHHSNTFFQNGRCRGNGLICGASKHVAQVPHAMGGLHCQRPSKSAGQ
jgi:hypothetical protein